MRLGCGELVTQGRNLAILLPKYKAKGEPASARQQGREMRLHCGNVREDGARRWGQSCYGRVMTCEVRRSADRRDGR